jgi:hypothetical protein
LAEAWADRHIAEILMQYMLLIVEPKGRRLETGRSAGEGLYQRMVDFSQALTARGVLVATNSLRDDAVRLEKRNGVARVLDGPFTESKEMIGGFFLLECATRAEAMEVARQCPAAEWATIEVRGVGPCYE